MKRYIAIALSLVICFSCLIAPASASSFDVPEAYYNVLDYATPNDLDSYAVTFVDQSTISFDISELIIFSHVDIVVNSLAPITSASIKGNSLNIVKITTGVYRLYGDIPYMAYNTIDLTLSCDGETKVNFDSFLAYNGVRTAYSELGSFDVYEGSGTLLQSKKMTEISKTISYDIPSDATPTEYTIDFRCDNWKQYDFLAFRFRTRLQVKSVVGMTSTGMQPLPVDLTYNVTNFSGSSFSYYYVIVDIRNILKSSNDEPIVQVRASRTSGKAGTINYYDCVGYVSYTDVDPEVSFFRKFANKLNTWISALGTGLGNKLNTLIERVQTLVHLFNNSTQDREEAEEFQEEIQEQTGQLDSMTDTMNSVTRPDVNTIDFGAGTMVDPNTLVLATGGISSLLSNPIITRILIMALTFGLVGFVLYGKK